MLDKMWDYCEKCAEKGNRPDNVYLFYGTQCPACGTENKRIGEVEEKDARDKV